MDKRNFKKQSTAPIQLESTHSKIKNTMESTKMRTNQGKKISEYKARLFQNAQFEKTKLNQEECRKLLGNMGKNQTNKYFSKNVYLAKKKKRIKHVVRDENKIFATKEIKRVCERLL